MPWIVKEVYLVGTIGDKHPWTRKAPKRRTQALDDIEKRMLLQVHACLREKVSIPHLPFRFDSMPSPVGVSINENKQVSRIIT